MSKDAHRYSARITLGQNNYGKSGIRLFKQTVSLCCVVVLRFI